jgi:hypothetical protein
MAGEEDRDKDLATRDWGPCILDDVTKMVSTCIHAGSGIASVKTRELDVPATAGNLEWLGALHKAKLNMVFLPLGSRCRVMIFATSIKLRCLDSQMTAEEREESVTTVLTQVSEGLVCQGD